MLQGQVLTILFRLGEIILNYVEAAFYLNDPNGDMLANLNNLRDRAGMPSLSIGQVSQDKIRQERRCELAFEEHTFWDLRRWRIAVEELDNKQRHRLHYRYNANTKKYTIEWLQVILEELDFIRQEIIIMLLG